MSNWIYSGEQIRELLPTNLFQSPQIKAFLNPHSRQFYILSSKGMGKTHLLRQKRAKVSSEAGAIVIPRSSGSDIDRQSHLPMNISEKTWNAIELEEWAALWEVSIGLTALLHGDLDLKDPQVIEVLGRLLESDYLPDALKDLVDQKVGGSIPRQANPSFVLNAILEKGASFKGHLLRLAQNLITEAYKRFIQSEINIFIDSFDQTLASTVKGNPNVWVNGQLGLILGAYHVNTQCAHIKTYTSVRQEAWNKFAHELKPNIESFCLKLDYKDSEYREMIDVLAAFYEGKKSISDVFPTKVRGKITNVGLGSSEDDRIEEDLFDYIFRHSLRTPRSLLHLISGLIDDCDLDGDVDAAVRSTVNSKSGALVATKIESEMVQFLGYLNDARQRQSFLAALQTNILTARDLERLTNFLTGGQTAVIHPFCEMYNLGLIGTLQRNQDGKLQQIFKSPIDFEWSYNGCLPKSEFYILHPGLEALVRNRYRLLPEPRILVANKAPWDSNWNTQIHARRLNIFVSYCSKNKELMERVERAITQQLFIDRIGHELWIDKKDIRTGEEVVPAISRGINWADVMICLVTEDYLNSKWCLAEMQAMQVRRMDGDDCFGLIYRIGDIALNRLDQLITRSSCPLFECNDEDSLVLRIAEDIRDLAIKKERKT